MKIKLSLFLLLIILPFLSFFSCKKQSEPEPIVGGPVRVYVTSTFDNSSLNNIPVTFECNGMIYEKETNGGMAKIDLDAPKQCTIKVNFSNSVASRNNDYIPSVLENIALTGNNEITLDIVEKAKLNPDGYSWKELLDAYRGGHNGAVNQVWVKQPEKWIVYDPNNVLKQYSDPKNNQVFNNIMEGFRAIQEYTNGFIIAPSKDKVEIRYKEERTPDGAISFKITDGEAFEWESVNSNNEIVRSRAGANPIFNYGNTVVAELVSSVQGGDNEAGRWIEVVFMSGKINPIDRIWGDFNYNKRKPGSAIILDGQYGHLYEIRIKQSQ